jgi:hypothetical protein
MRYHAIQLTDSARHDSCLLSRTASHTPPMMLKLLCQASLLQDGIGRVTGKDFTVDGDGRLVMGLYQISWSPLPALTQ